MISVIDSYSAYRFELKGHNPLLQADSSGKLWVVYFYEYSAWHYPVCCKSSIDGGVNWTEEFASTFSKCDGVALAIDSSDKVHVACNVLDGPNYRIYYRYYEPGSGWSGWQLIKSASSFLQHMNCVATPDGTVHIAWGNPTETATVQYRAKPPGGSWGSIETIAAQPSSTFSLALGYYFNQPIAAYTSPTSSPQIEVKVRDPANGWNVSGYTISNSAHHAEMAFQNSETHLLSRNVNQVDSNYVFDHLKYDGESWSNVELGIEMGKRDRLVMAEGPGEGLAAVQGSLFWSWNPSQGWVLEDNFYPDKEVIESTVQPVENNVAYASIQESGVYYLYFSDDYVVAVNKDEFSERMGLGEAYSHYMPKHKIDEILACTETAHHSIFVSFPEVLNLGVARARAIQSIEQETMSVSPARIFTASDLIEQATNLRDVWGYYYPDILSEIFSLDEEYLKEITRRGSETQAFMLLEEYIERIGARSWGLEETKLVLTDHFLEIVEGKILDSFQENISFSETWINFFEGLFQESFQPSGVVDGIQVC